jgi:DNA-binding FrmR family transcriptional regulator
LQRFVKPLEEGHLGGLLPEITPRRTAIEQTTISPNKELLDRLKRIEGQIRGLQRMIENERSCSEVITQVLAARSALEQVGTQMLDQQLLSCFPGEDPNLETLRRSLRLWVKFGAGS